MNKPFLLGIIGGSGLYQFENLTLVPYCKKLIDFTLLDNIEIEQIIKYYAEIKNKVWQHLQTGTQLWLDEELNI